MEASMSSNGSRAIPARKRLRGGDGASQLLSSPTACLEGKKRQRGSSTAREEQEPLDKVLHFCNGMIVDNVPNLQLLHIMMVYGHCGGGDGLCLETIQEFQDLQAKTYSRYMKTVVATLSPVQASNMQHINVPNDWTDLFCRIMLDMDGWKQHFIPEKKTCPAKLLTEILAICKKCRSLCMVTTPIPDLPASSAFCQEVAGWLEDQLIPWIASIYEVYSLFCFDDENMDLKGLPLPSKLGLTSEELDDWQRNIQCIAILQLRAVKAAQIKMLEAKKTSSSGLTTEMVSLCWGLAITLQKELTNFVLFYIAYPVRKKHGQVFLQKKVQMFLEGRLPGSRWMASVLGAQDTKLLNTVVQKGRPIPLMIVTERLVKGIILCGSSSSKPLLKSASLQIIEFAHGFMQSLITKDKIWDLQKACVLDNPGKSLLLSLFLVSELLFLGFSPDTNKRRHPPPLQRSAVHSALHCCSSQGLRGDQCLHGGHVGIRCSKDLCHDLRLQPSVPAGIQRAGFAHHPLQDLWHWEEACGGRVQHASQGRRPRTFQQAACHADVRRSAEG